MLAPAPIIPTDMVSLLIVWLSVVGGLADRCNIGAQEKNNTLLLEPDGYYTGRMIYNEEEMYRIEYIANNTFMKVSSGEELYPILDATIKTRTLEPVPS